MKSSERFIIEHEYERKGYKCVIVFTRMGHRCGYVCIPEDDKFFGISYPDDMLDSLSVHGGITYSQSGSEDYPIEGDNSVWWLGFDCAHYMDIPDFPFCDEHFNLEPYEREYQMEKYCYDRYNYGYVRDMYYVEDELNNLVDQIFDINNNEIYIKKDTIIEAMEKLGGKKVYPQAVIEAIENIDKDIIKIEK